jgi:hypothetical protein
MDEEEKKKLISAWIWHHIDSARGRHSEEYFWAWEKLEDLVSEQPELALELILAILAKDKSDVVVSNLAAGPLENLLARHGRELIVIGDRPRLLSLISSNLHASCHGKGTSICLAERVCYCRESRCI